MSKFFLPIILLSALVLRIFLIDDMYFWYDELWTAAYWAEAESYLAVWNKLNISVEANLPFYPFLILTWAKLFGSGEVALKIPSLIAGILSIYSIHLLGKSLFSKGDGLIAASLTAFLTVPYYYSVEARGYSFLFLFIILNMYSIVNKDKRIWYFSSVSLCWLHYFGILFIGLQFLWDFFEERKQLSKYLLPCLSLVIISPLIYFHLHNGTKLAMSDAIIMMKSFPYWIFHSGYYELTLLLNTAFALMIVYTIMFFNRKLGWLWYLSLTPLMLVIFVSFFIRPMFSERYLIIILPSAYLLVSHGFKYIMDRFRVIGKVVVYGLMIALFSGAVIADLKHFQPLPRVKDGFNHISRSDNCDKQILLPFDEIEIIKYYEKEFPQIHFLIGDPQGDQEMSFWFLKGIYSDRDKQRLKWHLEKFNSIDEVAFERFTLYCLSSRK
jgi:hypothetical protein